MRNWLRRDPQPASASVLWAPEGRLPELVPAREVHAPGLVGEWAYRVRFTTSAAPGAVTTVLVSACEAWDPGCRLRVVAWFSYQLGHRSVSGGGEETAHRPPFANAADADQFARQVAHRMATGDPRQTTAAWAFFQFWNGTAGALDWMEEERFIEMEEN